MLKALSAVSLDSSLLKVQPWQNPWLILGTVAVGFAFMIIIICVCTKCKAWLFLSYFTSSPFIGLHWHVYLDSRRYQKLNGNEEFIYPARFTIIRLPDDFTRLMVLKFSLPIMILEEVLKFMGRRVIEWKEMAAKKVRDAASKLDGGQHSVFPPPFF
jgi:hypothetical protein